MTLRAAILERQRHGINAGNRPRVAALESRTDAAQRWQDEVRKAIAAGR